MNTEQRMFEEKFERMFMERLTTVKVPKFKDEEAAFKFYMSLTKYQAPSEDIINPATGEVYLDKGQRGGAADDLKKAERKHKKEMAKYDLELEDDWVFEAGVDSEDDFKERYTVLEKSLEKMLGKKEAEEMRNADYDVSMDVPVKISSKKNPKLTDLDVASIENYIEWLESEKYEHIENIGLHVSAIEGKKFATVQAIFN